MPYESIRKGRTQKTKIDDAKRKPKVVGWVVLTQYDGQLFALTYSRDMERQADILGTRLLVASGYAADGLRNLMVTLDQQKKFSIPTWLSSHPGGNERVRYLEQMIVRHSYNRYAFEGVERHGTIQARVKKLLQEKK